VASSGGLPVGAVSFLVNGSAAATVALNASGQATFTTSSLAQGMHSVVAQYQGSTNFTASTSNTVSQLVNAADLNLSMGQGPNSASVRAGGSVNISLNISANGALSAPVSFACSGLPPGGQCAFSPSSLAANALPATVAVTLTTSGVQIGAFGGRGNVLLAYLTAGMMLPALVLVPFARRRKRLHGVAAVMLLLLLAVLAGCGGGGSTTPAPNPTPPTGTFNVTVTAISGSKQSSTMITLTVTP
jgi:hypothetical protein